MSADTFTPFRDVAVPIVDADAHVQDPPHVWITMDRQFRGLPLDDVREFVHADARDLCRIPAPSEP